MNAYHFLAAVFALTLFLTVGKASEAARRVEQNPIGFFLPAR